MSGQPARPIDADDADDADDDKVVDLVQEEVSAARARVEGLSRLLVAASELDRAAGLEPGGLDSHAGGLLRDLG